MLYKTNGRYSIYCVSRLFLNWALPVLIFFWCPFFRTPCRSCLDRDGIRIFCSVSEETGHFTHPLFMEIVQDIAMVGMRAGEACPCVAESSITAAVLAVGAFYGLFFIFHYAVSFLFSSFIRCSMWYLAKMWKLSSRYVCPFSSISLKASFSVWYHACRTVSCLLHTSKVTIDVGYLRLCRLKFLA